VIGDRRAVFFDFDGVIVDSVDVKTKAFCSLYQDYGPEIVAKVEAYHLANGGLSRFHKFAHFQKEFVHGPSDPETIATLSERFSCKVKNLVIAAPEIPGARTTLERLKGRLPLFLVSATPEPELRDIVEARKLISYFNSVHGAPHGKAEIVAQLLTRHRLQAASCVFIGDAMADLEAARRNGVSFIGIVSLGGSSPFPPATRVIPDLVGFAECVEELCG
jgi:HAD superfamily hydrolase (TIGR01509 family)